MTIEQKIKNVFVKVPKIVLFVFELYGSATYLDHFKRSVK